MLQLRAKLLAALFLAVSGSVARADPPIPSHDHWRNTSHHTHYVLYNAQTRQYDETVDCRVLWRFRQVSNALNTLTIHDDSRGMTVRLTYEGMYLQPAGAAGFSFYQPGTFDRRTRFLHYQGSTYTGSLSKRNGCIWEEWFPGGTAPAFRFGQTVVTNDAIEMYDGSRDLTVRLTSNAMYLKSGNGPFVFFKSGQWN